MFHYHNLPILPFDHCDNYHSPWRNYIPVWFKNAKLSVKLVCAVFFFFPFFAWKLLPSFGKGLLLLWQLEKVDKTVNLNPMWEIWPRNTSMVFTFFNWLEQLYLYSLLYSNKCNYREHWKYSHVQSGSYTTKKELVTWYFKILSDCM